MGENWLISVRSSVFGPSVRHLLIKCFVKDFSITMQARMIILGIQIDENRLYLGTLNVKKMMIILRIQIYEKYVVLWDFEPAFSSLFFPVFAQYSFFPYFE